MSEESSPKYELLPTGKPHVSFSEMKDWDDCSFRHKLKYVDKIGIFKPGVHMDFGTAVHAACENFLKTKKMDDIVFKKKLHELWTEHGEVDPEAYTVKSFKQFVAEGIAILPEIPAWFDVTFPGWEFIDAEHQFYEPVFGHPHAFKGFIDCVIAAPGKNGKTVTWLLDFKTTSWGWNKYKKADTMVRAQLVLYKSFWGTKMGIDPKDIKCGFVLLKRTAKPNQHCELVPAAVSELTTSKSLMIVGNMLTAIKRGIALKDKSSCTYCEYKNTEHCP